MCNRTGAKARHPRFKMVRLPFEVFDLERDEEEALVVAFPPNEAPWGFLFTRDDYGSMRMRRIAPNLDRNKLRDLPILCPGVHPNCGTPHGDAAHAFMASIPDNILNHFVKLMDADEAGRTAKGSRSKSIRY